MGLDSGADDYGHQAVFAARRCWSSYQCSICAGRPTAAGEETDRGRRTWCWTRHGHRVTVGDRTVQLGPTEYRLLSFFMTHAERVYSRAQLLDRVWGGNVYVEERTVDVHIRRLRKALEAFNYDRFIQTVRGSGYRFSTRGVAVEEDPQRFFAVGLAIRLPARSRAGLPLS